MSWFKKGQEAVKALEEAERASQLLKEKSAPRLWLKAGEEAYVIFVDDEPFWCERHIVKLGTKFVEFTCRAGETPCPLCLKEDKRPLGLTYYTVIDLRKYERRDGTIAKYTKALLPARRTLAQQLNDFKQRLGSLVGIKFKLKRYSQQDPSCGIIIDFDRDAKGRPKKYNLNTLGKDYTLPFNYEKVLAPPTDEELKALGYSLAIIGDTPIIEDELEPDIEEEIENEDVEQEEIMDEEEEELEDTLEEGEDFEDDLTLEDIKEEFDEVEDLEEDFEEEPKKKKETVKDKKSKRR